MFTNNKPVKQKKESLDIYKNILVELNNKYPKLLPSFVYELQFPGILVHYRKYKVGQENK